MAVVLCKPNIINCVNNLNNSRSRIKRLFNGINWKGMEGIKAYKHSRLIGLQTGETETKERKRYKNKSVYIFTHIRSNDTETNHE